MEQFATAIVGALISGAAKTAEGAVGELYEKAKSLMSQLLPEFDTEIKETDEDASVSDLAQKLSELSEEERAKISDLLGSLAKEAGAHEEADDLRKQFEYSIERLKAAGTIDLELFAEGSHKISDLVSETGQISIKTRSQSTEQ